MIFLVPLAMFLFLMAAIGWVGYRFYARPQRFVEQVGGMSVFPRESGVLSEPPKETLGVRALRTLGEKMPSSPADVSVNTGLLLAAGHRSEHALKVFFGIRSVSAAVGLFLGLSLYSVLTDNTVLRLLIIAGGAFIGWSLPGLLLDMLVSSRQDRIKLALPDALDLLTVCVEAGLGFDQALVNVARELRTPHPDLSEEIGLLTLEVNAGKRRADALRNLAERTRVGEVQKLTAILIQTDRFGTSMAESLRTHSDFMRVRRRQEAEEKANKVGVKLVFPIFFFILPSMLVVVAGPGLLQIFKQLFPMMRNYGSQMK